MRSVTDVRRDIDKIDDRIVDCLSSRAALAREMRAIKLAQNIVVHDPDRECLIIARIAGRCEEQGLEKEPVTRIFGQILEYMRSIVANGEGEQDETENT